MRAAVVPAVNRLELQTEILNHLMPGSKLYTDSAKLYQHIPKEFTHQFVDHMKQYVRGRVHTNGMENFWSLLKRGLNGTYVAVEPFHLSRVSGRAGVPLQSSARCARKQDSRCGQILLAVSQITGKRLTYAELTGKVGETQN